MKYETNADLEREVNIVNAICRTYQCSAFKMPQKSRVDFALTYDGEVMALIEIKSRNCSINKYDTYMISKGKYDALVNYRKLTHLTTSIFVQWTDSLGFITIPCDYTEGTGGRWDRGDDNDVEKVVYIPITNFTEVG